MEQETQFKAVFKKSVAMFNMLTGKKMTEREGRAFIEIFDMAEGYLKTVAPDAAETFDVLSQVTYEGPTDEERQEHIKQLLERTPRPRVDASKAPEIPKFVGRTFEDATLYGTGIMQVSPSGVRHISHEELDKSPLHDLLGARKNDTDPQAEDTREAEIEAAWQSREIEQAEEADRIESNLRAAKAKNSFDTDRRDDHREGFDYQIVALCRLGVRTNSIIRCFATMPSPAEFWELYRKYEERTHWCFINEWNPHKGWLSILEPYMLS